MKIGSLCTGYGGLDMAVESLWPDAELHWVAENDRNMAALLKVRRRYPLNIGDITQTDWGDVPSVDVLTAGYPCQPFSNAGMRRGPNDERHLWPHIRQAIEVLRPSLIVLENVAAHMSLGGPQVVRETAQLGYCVRWGIVRASDAGAPHRRARLFIIAIADPSGERHGPREVTRTLGRLGIEAARSGRATSAAWQITGTGTAESHRQGQLATRITEDIVLRSDKCSVSAQSAAMTKAPTTAPIAYAPAPTESPRSLQTASAGQPVTINGLQTESSQFALTDFGVYSEAVAKWSAIVGRPAPQPLVWLNRWTTSPRFAEWMMGLPDGHVSAAPMEVPAQLKALGNGVCPQQAALALRLMLGGAP